jgi:phosphonate transport system substrate-binding protein
LEGRLKMIKVKNKKVVCSLFMCLILIFTLSSISFSAGEKYGGLKVLRIGLQPAENAPEVIKETKTFVDTIEKGLGIKVEAYVATDYVGNVEAMRAKKLEVAFIGPFTYILASEIANAEAFCAIVRADIGKPYYKGVFISHVETGIKKIGDFKGKTFSFVDVASTSGYLMPRYMMIKAGVDPEKDLKGYSFSGGHDASILAVYHKKVDVAMTGDNLLSRAISKGLVDSNKIRIIAHSDPIPISPFMWRRDLPDDLKKDLRKVFTSIKGMPFAMTGLVASIVPVTDSDFDQIRDLAKYLKLDLKKMK